MKIKLNVMFYIYNTTSTVIKQQVMNNLTTITNSISSENTISILFDTNSKFLEDKN